MSIGASAGGETACSEQLVAATAKDKVPRRRQTVAKLDAVVQPEAR
jgi:hypothetical protein